MYCLECGDSFVSDGISADSQMRNELGVGGVCTAFAAVCYGWKGRRGRKIRNGCKQNRWNVREMLETVETNLATSNVEGKKMEISTDFSFYILLKIKSRDNGR